MHLADLEREVAQLEVHELPQLLGDLERLRATAWSRLVTLTTEGSRKVGQPDELLGVKQAAATLGLSPDYLYRHWRNFPFVVREGRRLLCSSRGIDAWIINRRGRQG